MRRTLKSIQEARDSINQVNCKKLFQKEKRFFAAFLNHLSVSMLHPVFHLNGPKKVGKNEETQRIQNVQRLKVLASTIQKINDKPKVLENF